MISETGKHLECFESNLDIALRILIQETQETDQIVGHLHQDKAYLSVRELGEKNDN